MNKRVQWVVVAVAVFTVFLAAVNVSLYSSHHRQEKEIAILKARQDSDDKVRAAEARGAVARKQLSCSLLASLRDVAIDIPITNLRDILDSGTLTPTERVDRLQALARYRKARESFSFALKACVR